ncbi:MAG: 2-oxoacid ferredoxin oxidoreductase [Lentisphaerae bacterium ADurb.Bin242]|nr:MAG: 2-oxoacid ferredoxin oxidoreductase [Lentisphaerae bacterium ADurb.Bin242]
MAEKRVVLSGDEAVAEAALACGVMLGTGYPGTPSTEILEHFSAIGGKAQWSPNEKVALEVGIGVAFAGARSLVTMKHVGLNVAADPLFTLTYTGVEGGLVVVSADDPGMASSQNEQDNRLYAAAAHLPVFEPSDSREAYDFTLRAFALSEEFHTPVLLRMTTRVCHSRSPVTLREEKETPVSKPYRKNIQERVMVPAFAKKAHVTLFRKMEALARWNEKSDLNQTFGPETAERGIITSGAAFQHSMEAAPGARILKLGMTWPLPFEAIAKFVAGSKRTVVVEEGEKFLAGKILEHGIPVEPKADAFLFGELDVARVKKLLARDESPEPAAKPGRPPQLCPGCPHRKVFETLRDLGCIVSGDIGCYTLGVMPPFDAIDSCVCMGASIGAGLGLRHGLAEAEARKVVSVIGDSTFVHSGLTGIVEMVYNKPATGHLVLILDNATTAMTGLQENPATGRHLDMSETTPLNLAAVCKAIGADSVDVIDPTADNPGFVALVKERLASSDASVIIARRPCILQVKKLAKTKKQ